MRFELQTCGRERYDEIVEALLYAEHGTSVYAVQGRGGDEGIDVAIEDADGLTIFQLKYFTEGFSGAFAARRKQIKKSFDQAWKKHKPRRWVLVFPSTASLPERRWVKELGIGKDVTIDLMDRHHIEGLLARHTQVLLLADRHPLLQGAAEYGLTTTTIADGDDYARRLELIAKHGNAMDAFWEPDPHRVGDELIVWARPKRPDAQQARPLGLEITCAEPTPAEALSLDRVFGFGTSEEISFDVSQVVPFGPEFIRLPKDALVSFQHKSTSALTNTRIALTARDSDGRVIATHDGLVTHANHGARGLVIEAEFYEIVKLELLLDRDTLDGQIQLTLHEFGGRHPMDLRDGLKMERQLRMEAHRLDLRHALGDMTNLTVQAHSRHERPDLQAIEQAVDDLVWILPYAERGFTFPEGGLQLRDRLMLRIARRILDGACVPMPDDLTLTGVVALEHVHPTDRTEPKPTFAPGRLPIVIGGHRITIPDVTFYHPRATARIASRPLAGASEVDVTVTGADGTPFRAFHTERLRGVPEPERLDPLDCVGFPTIDDKTRQPQTSSPR